MVIKKLLFVALIFSTVGCTSIKNSYDLISFRKDPNSGITNQEMGVNFIYNDRFDVEIDMLFTEVGEYVPDILVFKRSCSNNTGELGGNFSPIVTSALPAIIAFIGSETYEYLKSSISTYAEELAKQSVAEKIIKVPFHGKQVKDWQKVNCIAITRYNVETNDIGLFILLQKEKLTDSYIITPRLIYLKNSPAITEVGTSKQPAKITIDIGFAIHAILRDKKTSKYNNIEVSSMAIPLGAMEFGETRTIVCQSKNAKPYCKEASSLIPYIPRDSKTVEVAFKVVETGSAANAKTLAESTNKALDGIVKPLLDQLVGQVSSQLGQ